MSTQPSRSPGRPAGPPLVAATGLSVRLGGRVILDRADLEVRPGEIVTLIGPNGAGKTTLVRAVLGLVRPAAGTVRRRPGLRIGYMPQRLTVDATLPLTVRRFLGLWRPAPAGRIAAVLAEAGVEHLADRPVQAVSGGELQRVMLARALVGDPDLLVLDEPDQAVDVHGQAELFGRIEALRTSGRTELADQAEQMVNVMAPHSGGLLSALEAAPQAGVVFVAHTGLDKLVTVRDIWRELPMDKRIVMKGWSLQPDEVPRDVAAQEVWLFEHWRAIDEWIAQRG